MCGGAVASDEIVPDANCQRLSPDYSGKYNELTFNIPDENTPIKTILVNFNVFQKSDGTGNWQNTPDHINRLNQIIEWASQNYSNIPLPSDPITGVPHISDSKIRIELANIYFYQDDILWQSTSASDCLDEIEDTDPSRLDQLNICITGGTGNYSGYANLPSSSLFSSDSYILTLLNEAQPNGDWAFALHIAHELGHNFDLCHTYYSPCPEECSFSDPEFLDDVFGTDPCPTAPPGCDICYHDAGWNCDPTLSTNTCTNNLMGGTQSMYYLSPKQMAILHRSLSIRSVRRYVKEMPKSEYPLEISSNETWDFNIKLYSDLVVNAGATLTLNCEVLMPSDGKIIIENGGKLIVDGAKITNGGESPWAGIEVWGDPNQSHDIETAHGVLETKNDAVIENAYCAIYTCKKNENGSHTIGFDGGIVKAENTTFLNNRRAIEVWPFQYLNHTFFSKCNFETSEAILGGYDFDAFVIMNDINGVEFEGCSFTNSRDASELSAHYRGKGIYSIESQYLVTEFVDLEHGNTPCDFSNLEYGIKALGLTSAKAPSIKLSNFTANITGVYLSGITSASVLSNNFYVKSFDDLYLNYIYCGLYLDNSTRYHVENNLFEYDESLPSGEDHIIGLTVNNSGELDNEIYRNYFYKLDIGVLAENSNRSSGFGFSGLEIRCNDFGDGISGPSSLNNTIDVSITTYPDCSTCGIKYFQGSDYDAASPAGNRFSHNDPLLYSDISNEANPIRYYHHLDVPGSRVIPMYYTPGAVTLQPTQFLWDEIVACPPTLIFSGMDQLESMIAMDEVKADSINDLLNVLVDGGNTQELESDIVLSTPDEAYELHTDLMNKSPYLTDTVMIEAVNKEDVLTPVMVKEVLVANPQSAKSDTVMLELDNRMNPLPDYMITEIEQGELILGDKENLESEKSYYLHRKSINKNKLIKLYREDYNGSTLRDSLISYLSNENNVRSKYELAFEYLLKDEYTSGSITISNIPIQFTLNNAQNILYQKYNGYYSLLYSLYQSNGSVLDLDANQIAYLSTLSPDIYSEPGAYARNALLFNNLITYEEPYILPENTLKFEDFGEDSFDDNTSKAPEFKIYPNPAKDYITLEYNLAENSCNGYLEFWDLQGRFIYRILLSSEKHSKIISTKDLNTGLYLCKLVCNGEIIGSERISIVK